MKYRSISAVASKWAVFTWLVVVSLGCSHLVAADGGEVVRISKEQLKAVLGNPGTVIIDVRSARDWESSDQKIPGAIRQPPSSNDLSWSAAYAKDQPIYLYCA